MLKTLLKKQMLELNKGFFYDSKKGTARKKGARILMIVGYAALMVLFLGGVFTALSLVLLQALRPLGLDWLFFTVMTLISVFLGVFGSVFNTYSSLYKARDNDLLLSLPIPAGYVLTARLAGVYLMGLMFSSVVLLPAVIVYFVCAAPGVASVLGCVLLILLVSVFVLTLSCLLGWCVAKISVKVKNKSAATVVFSLLFFFAYYYLCNNANELLQSFLGSALLFGGKIQNSAYPLYVLGRVGTGDGYAMLWSALVVGALFVATCLLLSRSFFKLALSSGKTKNVRYREKAAKERSVERALRWREFRHFLSSANYMLNCGLGALFTFVAGVLLLWKGDELWRNLAPFVPKESNLPMMIVTAALCMLSSMTDITAPSISLEGRELWLIQSLPLRPWQCLRAKLEAHLLVQEPPVVFTCLCACFVFRPSPLYGVLALLIPSAFTLFVAALGLCADLRNPNLKWTSEVVPVKQNLSVVLSLLGGWIFCLLLAAGYFFLRRHMSGAAYLGLCLALLAGGCCLLLRWLRVRGAKRLETL